MTDSRVWRVVFDEDARRDFAKLDLQIQRKIQRYLRERLATDEDPKRFGKPLSGNLKDFWRYRIEDYRLICRIVDDQLIVIVVEVGHRRAIYE